MKQKGSLNRQCAKLDGACVHDWKFVGSSVDTQSHWKCFKCKEIEITSHCHCEKPSTTNLNYCGSVDTAVAFARRMGVYLIIHRCYDAVYILIKANTVRGCRDLAVGIYSKHNGNEIKAEATAICTAVIDMKEKA